MSIGSEITQLLLNQGNIAARAAEARGQAIGQSISGAAQSIGAGITAATDPRRQLEQAQVTELQRQQKGRGALADAIKAGGDDEAIATRVSSAGFPDVGEAWLKTKASNAENFQKLMTARRDYQKAQAETIGDLAYSAKDVTGLTASIGAAAQHGLLDEQQAHQVLDFVAQGGDQALQQVRGKYLPFSPKYQKEQEELRKPEKVGQGESLVRGTGEVLVTGAPKPLVLGQGDTAIDPATGAVIATGGQKAADEFQTFKQSYPRTLGKTDWSALTPQEQVGALGAYAESKADPAMRAAALAQKNLAEMMAKAQLNAMPTPEQAKSVADDLVNHRIAPEQLASLFSTRGKEGLAFKLAVTAEAKKLDPAFNFEEASANYNLVKSQGFQNTVRYMDSVQESMPRLLENANKLGRGSFRSWNELQNAAANQFNSVDLKKLKTDALLVGDEVAKILSGGGTGSATSDAKLKQATELISASDSVPALAGALGEIDALIGFRRRSLTRGTYMEGTSAAKPSPAEPIKVGGFTVTVK